MQMRTVHLAPKSSAETEGQLAAPISIDSAVETAAILYASARLALIDPAPAYWAPGQREAQMAGSDFVDILDQLAEKDKRLNMVVEDLFDSVMRDAFIASMKQGYNGGVNPVIAATNRTTWPFLSMPPAADATPRGYVDEGLPQRQIALTMVRHEARAYQSLFDRSLTMLHAHAQKDPSRQRLVTQLLRRLIENRECNAIKLDRALMADAAHRSSDALSAFVVTASHSDGEPIAYRWAWDRSDDNARGAHSAVAFSKARVAERSVGALDIRQPSHAVDRLRETMLAELEDKVRLLVVTRGVVAVDADLHRVVEPELPNYGFPTPHNFQSRDPNVPPRKHAQNDRSEVARALYEQSVYNGYDIYWDKWPRYLFDREYLEAASAPYHKRQERKETQPVDISQSLGLSLD